MAQSGSVWNSNKINLTNSFDFWFNIFMGCNDANGADGMVFILQPNSTSVGASGEGMGFDGVQPSIGIALDTWQNNNWNDPFYDHISIQANGNINHNNDLAGPVAISATSNNVEDCRWHRLRITWDAGTKWLRAYFDGVLRVEKQIDLVSTIFHNDPSVYWGFTGATGGQVNLQQFCTALNPIFTTDLANNNGCTDAAVHFTNASESFAPIVSYNWSFGDGTGSSLPAPLPHTYTTPGSYLVNLKIKGQDGCEKDSTFSVVIHGKPAAAFAVADTCSGSVPRVQFAAKNTGVSYRWELDGVPFSTTQQPAFTTLSEGAHRLQVEVSSDYQCGPPASAVADFVIRPRPAVASSVDDGCVGQTLFFTGTQNDQKTTIAQWNWSFGDGSRSVTQSSSHVFSSAGDFTVKLWAMASNGCGSDTQSYRSTINEALVNAGRDTVVIKDLPFQLHGVGNGDFLWSPSSGLSNATIADPVATLSNDQQYILTVSTAEGCQAKDTILIKTFKGPAVYVPSAFTPNGDGRNETLKPVYVGIRELKQFVVFNRWGQVVFSTTDMQKGWTAGRQPEGTYVWLIRAVDTNQQNLSLKGTVTIIR